MTLDDSTFESLADETLEALMDAIEAQLGDDIDADIQSGILTLEFDDGRQYVINKHASTRQIWLSSPMSGAKHFAYDGEVGAWLSTRGGEELKGLLAGELFKLTGNSVTLT